MQIPPPIFIPPYELSTDTSDTSSSCNHRKKYLFRKPISISPLIDVLNAVAPKIDGNKWFHFNVTAYRKMVYQQLHIPFITKIQDYYCPAKWRKYGNKELTYSSFTTILRQMCNEVGLAFYTKIVYDHSICNTVYFISAEVESEVKHISPPSPSPSSPCSVADNSLLVSGRKRPTIVGYDSSFPPN